MKQSSSFINGVLPPMITPFKENGDVDFAAFEFNVNKWNETKLAGFLVNGSNSEAAYTTQEEQLQLVKLTVKNAKTGKHIMAGTGCESLRATINFTKACAENGAQSALVLTPSYYDSSMSSKVLINFFTKLADASPIPILIYNVPKFTHVNIKADAIHELSKHENIVGMKDSTGDVPQLATFLRVADPSFQVLVGTASAWYPALCLGIKGSVMALANSHPDECCKVQALYEEKNFEASRDLYQKLFPINTAVTGTFGIPGLKWVCTLRGYQGGFVREPLLELTDGETEALMSVIKKADNDVEAR